MLGASLLHPGGLSLDAYGAVVFDARQRQLLVNTLQLGIGAALVAALIGIPLGFGLARVPLRAVRVLGCCLPRRSPCRPTYWPWRGCTSAGSYSLPAAALVLGAGYFPLVMLATEAAGRGDWRERGRSGTHRCHPASRASEHHVSADVAAGGGVDAARLRAGDLGIRRARAVARSSVHHRGVYRVCGAVRLQAGDGARAAARRADGRGCDGCRARWRTPDG